MPNDLPVYVPEEEEPIDFISESVGENEQRALTVIRAGMSIVVRDQTSLTAANGLLLDVKALRRKFDNEFNPGIAQAFAHHRYLTAQKKKWTDPLDEAERAIKPKITDYLVEQDRIRLEAERAVQRAKEAAAKAAQDAADEALALIEQGKTAQADKVVEAAAAKIEDIQADTPFVPDKPVAVGASIRETWDYEVTDESLIPRKFLIIDHTTLRRYAAAMKHQADVPGVRFFSVKSVASRSGT
jgi:vacuolar-type H+-ATPase subunit H